MWLIISILLVSSRLFAIDFGFRFKEGFCQKNSRPGFNPNEMNECGMLTSSRLINQKHKDLNLKGANLSSSYIYMSTFVGGDSSNLALKRSVVLQSEFSDVNLDSIDLRGSQIKGSEFKNSSLKNSLASGARISKTKFKNVNFEASDFWGAQLHEVDFIDCDLLGVDFRNTSLLFNKWHGSRFNSMTQLPFSKEVALEKEMIYVE